MLFDQADIDGHEQVLFCHDQSVGLKAIIALHSTVLGPAAGGCRMHPYESDEAALKDVLRLSKGMTYKNALAGLPLGGGKCVIIADPNAPNKQDLLRAFAQHVQSLNGRYWTAIDIGVGPADADTLAEKCDFIFARASQYEPDFSASLFTAFGGFVGIKAAAELVLGRGDLKGLKVAVQGVGSTGYALCKHLYNEGAELYVTDVQSQAVDRVVSEFGALSVAPEFIHSADVDVFAPCAMGGVINDRSIKQIRAKVICGVANNQLAEDRHGKLLADAGIAYVPDYVVNAGGMMGASTVIFTKPSRDLAYEQINGLEKSIKEILTRAVRESRSSAEIADEMALKIIQTKQGSRECQPT